MSEEMAVDMWSWTSHFDSWVKWWYGELDEVEDDDTLKVKPHQPQSIFTKISQKPLARSLAYNPKNCIVRDAVCITGPNWTSLQNVKQTVSEIVPRSFKTALETFHIKYVDDMTDGELLVPKVIVVVHHVVGRLLIDDNTDTGQIDYLYDTLCDTGADMFLIYLDLPRVLYPAMKHIIYHPRLIDLVFPEQTIVRELAEENRFVSVVEGCAFSDMQKNVLREWLLKPVSKQHAVYKNTEKFLDSLGGYLDDVSFWSESELQTSSPGFDPYFSGGYQTAVEQPSRSKSGKKTKRVAKFKAKLANKTLSKKGYMALPGDDDVDFMGSRESINQSDVNEYIKYT